MESDALHNKIMRKVIGVMVILLPIVPVLLGFLGKDNPNYWYTSISASYYTNSCGLFCYIMGVCSCFFMTYPGYDWRDRLVNFISGLSLAIIVLFPCGDDCLGLSAKYVGLFQLPPSVSTWIHSLIAIFLFVTLYINVRFLFTKTSASGIMSPQKEKRNLIYKICANAIWPAAVCLGLSFISAKFHIFVLIAEALMLIPCGFAWLVKAEVFKKFNDK